MSATVPDCSCPDGVEIGGQLTGPECRAWISERSEGRLGHQTGRGRRTVVVNYAVTDDQVVLRLPEYNEICQYALGRLVTLNVSGTCSNTWLRTEVAVTGVGHFPEERRRPSGHRRSCRALAGRHGDAHHVPRPQRHRGFGQSIAETG